MVAHSRTSSHGSLQPCAPLGPDPRLVSLWRPQPACLLLPEPRSVCEVPSALSTQTGRAWGQGCPRSSTGRPELTGQPDSGSDRHDIHHSRACGGSAGTAGSSPRQDASVSSFGTRGDEPSLTVTLTQLSGCSSPLKGSEIPGDGEWLRLPLPLGGCGTWSSSAVSPGQEAEGPAGDRAFPAESDSVGLSAVVLRKSSA